MSNYAMAVDIGGTFTDVVLRSSAGHAWTDKTLTTPESLDIGFFRAVDVAQAEAIVEELKRQGVVTVAVSLLNAYLNPENERVLRDIITKRAPDMYVSISSDVAPQIREYPRTSTVAMNAYTAPITGPYLDALSRGLKQRGFVHAPLIMLSNGGVIGIDVAKRFPVRMVESGPAGGALAASYYAEVLGLDRLLSFDMGGTTAKACIIEDRHPLVVGNFEVDRIYRFKAGSGLPILIPSVDMIEIGAGGGSIASMSDLGLLKVGPQSAGSVPGPVCYGRGGQNPTVTDADLVLGYLSADNFLGGEMKLDRDGAVKALTILADQLGTSL